MPLQWNCELMGLIIAYFVYRWLQAHGDTIHRFGILVKGRDSCQLGAVHTLVLHQHGSL